MALQLSYPLNGPITQYFGENPDFYARWGYAGHNGIDFGVASGTQIRAAATGTVEKVGFEDGGYGYFVKLSHKDGASTYYTYYAHMVSQSTIAVGKSVAAGELIGSSGNTGASTGPHLHFGLRTVETTGPYKGYLDPMPYLTGAAAPVTTPVAAPTSGTVSSSPVTAPVSTLPQNPLSGVVPLPNLQFVVNTNELNVRNGPGVTFGIVGKLKLNAVVTATKLFSDSAWIEFEAGKWSAVTYAGVANVKATSFGASMPVQPGAAASMLSLPNMKFEVLATELNVRNGPGVSNALLAKVKKGAVLASARMSSQNLWIEHESGKWCAVIFGGIQNLRTK